MHDDAIVRLSNLGKQDYWTGVVISEAGEILTTSQALGNAPIVDIELSDGTRGQACVTGRDDRIGLGLALLKPLLEPRAYDFAELSGAAPVVGDQLGLLQHTRFSSALDQRITSVSEYRSDSSGYGYDYFQIRAADATSDGAVLINDSALLQGMRMPSRWLLVYGVAGPGEVWAVDALSIASTVLPVLHSGRMNIDAYHPFYGPYDSPPPRIPVVFHGSITVDGAPAPVGSVLYARVSKEGQPSYWEEGPAVYESGSFIIEVAAPYYDPVYDGATIEFWMDCRRSSTTAVYKPPVGGISGIIELDLAF